MAKTPDPIDVEVGSKIKAQRRLRGMSQDTLAAALGVTFQQIQKYEKGTNRVSSSRLAVIAKTFGVPPSCRAGPSDHTTSSVVTRLLAPPAGRYGSAASSQSARPARTPAPYGAYIL